MTTADARDRDLLIEGLGAIAHLLHSDPTALDRPEAEIEWDRFESRVRAAAETRLGRLARDHELGVFELRCLMLALACHTDPRIAEAVAELGGATFGRAATVRLALQQFCALPDERVDARRSFLASGALVYGRLISLSRQEGDESGGLLDKTFRLTQPTLGLLLGEDDLSEVVARIADLEYPTIDLLNVVLPAGTIKPLRQLIQHHGDYRALISKWGFDRVLPHGRGITLLFSGPSGTGKTLLAQALAGSIGRGLLVLSAADLPEGDGLEPTLRELFAEATIRRAIILIDECDVLLARGDKRKATVYRAVESYDGILILITNHPEKLDDSLERRILYHVAFEPPEAEQRRQIWEVHLPPEVPLEGDIDLTVLANLYDFTGGTIKNAILVAVNRALAERPDRPALTMQLLEEGCRSQLRYALEALTVRTNTHLRLKDIVLPESALRKVREVISACRNQAVVLNRWGFGRRLVTGKGITVLFDGPPGTGKTYCAEIIAGELNRALYRVNIPEVVSKWVGETEKNIRAIFQQARISHAMLLFDEADSLFAARMTETRSSNDRTANLEVNLLLQEIERFPGVCILTTNSFGSLDRALVRRIQFRITFEEPVTEDRHRIWSTLCPPEAPVGDDVDFGALARRYEMTGAMIKNALLRAAYGACDAGSDMTRDILEAACIDEYAAAGKVARVVRTS